MTTGTSAPLERITATGVVLVARLASTSALDGIARAAAESGVGALEVTLDTPGALQWLDDARTSWGERLALGAGTVMDAAAARDAAAAGAGFLVSPVLDESVVEAARDGGIPVIPGALTPSEIVRAHAAGAGLVKVYPASLGGPGYLASLRAPLAGIPLLATGGVTVANAVDFIAAGAAAVGLGGSLLDPGGRREPALDALEQSLRRALESVAAARGRRQRI